MPQKTNVTDATTTPIATTPTDTDAINTDTTNTDTSDSKSNAVDTQTDEIASKASKKKDNLLVRFLKFLRTAIIYFVVLFVVGALIFMLFIDNVEAQAWFSRATGGYLDGIATFLNSLF